MSRTGGQRGQAVSRTLEATVKTVKTPSFAVIGGFKHRIAVIQAGTQ